MFFSSFFRKRKTIFIHAGMSKTGTTSIQKMLSKSTIQLAEFDALYPRACRDKSISHNAFSDAIKFDKSTELLNDLSREIEASECTNIILSTELLERTKTEKWQTIKDLFSPHKVIVVLYLRRQDDAIMSMYNELSKKHANDLAFTDYLNASSRLALLDYKDTLAKIESVFGVRNLRVGVFSASHLYEGDIGKDFMFKLFGVKYDYKNFEASHNNSSMLPATSFIMARINRLKKFDIDHSKHYALACKLAETINPIVASATSNRHAYFSDEFERSRFLAQYADSNQYVSERYLSGKSFIDDSDRKPNSPLGKDEEVTILRKVHSSLVSEDCELLDADQLAANISDWWKTQLPSTAYTD